MALLPGKMQAERRRCFHKPRDARDGHRHGQQLPDAGERMEQILPQQPWEEPTCPHLDLGLPALRE